MSFNSLAGVTICSNFGAKNNINNNNKNVCHCFHFFYSGPIISWQIDFSGGKSGGLVFPSLYDFPQFVVIHTVKGFDIVNKAEVDVFLERSCFFDDPKHVGNLISSFSVFSKSSLKIWKFTLHILLMPGLENFDHYFANI